MENLSNTLHSLLAHNIVYFTFRKVNGEIRHAVGTRNLTLAEIHTGNNIPKPKGYENPTAYYDIEACGWRSYREENLISIDRVNDFDYATSEPIKQTKKGELPNDAPTESEIEIELPKTEQTEKRTLGGIPLEMLEGGDKFGLFGDISFGSGKGGAEIELPFGNTMGGGAKIEPKNAPERSFKVGGVEGIDIDTLADLIAKKVVERLFSGDVKRIIIERD